MIVPLLFQKSKNHQHYKAIYVADDTYKRYYIYHVGMEEVSYLLLVYDRKRFFLNYRKQCDTLHDALQEAYDYKQSGQGKKK